MSSLLLYMQIEFAVRVSSLTVSKQKPCIAMVRAMSTTRLKQINPSKSDSFLKSEVVQSDSR